MAQYGSRKQVLIVDDASMTRDILRLMLELEGFEVVGDARNAAEAVEGVRRHAPDIVFLDINLPDASGLTVLEALRREFPQVAVVMITVDDTADHMREAIRKGALGYVLKPLSEDRAINTIRNILHSHFGASVFAGGQRP